ncbi:MAG: glycoside hydrolase family 3 protein [Streptosporangiaceae bacterium]|nr:glycoside hydrolase family 3 protein [Streptosporangiaceae bacterium]
MSAELAPLVDRCLLFSMAGLSPSARFRGWLAEGLGGVLLYPPNIAGTAQLKTLCAELRAARADVLIAVNGEGGDSTPVYPETGSPHPSHLALGGADDPELTRAVAADIGNHLADLGVNLNLAPVADVGTNPANRLVGTRSFGADPCLVARHAMAYIDGLRAAGVAGAAKHFPGFGGAHASSDIDFPVVAEDPGMHLGPFRDVIGADVPAILTSHAIYPALDSLPATFSRTILTGLLREELGFGGVIIGDSLTMAMVIAQLGAAEAAVRAFASGADLICMTGGLAEQRAVRDHVIAAVTDGRLAAERLADAAARVTSLARAHARPGGTGPQRLEWDAGRDGRLLRIDAPLPLRRPPYVIEFPDARNGSEPAPASLLAVLRQLDQDVSGVRLTAEGAALAYAVRAAPQDRPLVLAARDAHRHPRLRANLSAILRLRHDAILVGLGSTGDAQLAPGRYVGTNGTARPSLQAAARSLLPPAADLTGPALLPGRHCPGQPAPNTPPGPPRPPPRRPSRPSA